MHENTNIAPEATIWRKRLARDKSESATPTLPHHVRHWEWQETQHMAAAFGAWKFHDKIVFKKQKNVNKGQKLRVWGRKKFYPNVRVRFPQKKMTWHPKVKHHISLCPKSAVKWHVTTGIEIKVSLQFHAIEQPSLLLHDLSINPRSHRALIANDASLRFILPIMSGKMLYHIRLTDRCTERKASFFRSVAS